MATLCADGTPYSTEGRCAVEILFLYEQRELSPEEFAYYQVVTARIRAEEKRVSKMSDAEILKLEY